MICQCPAATALSSWNAVQCTESFGQIQKVAFQRIYDGTAKNTVAAADFVTLAKWQTLTTSADGKKVVVSPYIQAPTNEANAPRTFGGGNDTLGGVEIIIGREPSAFSAVLRGIPQSVIKVMKELECEAAAGNLGVYLFDENGNIEALYDGTNYMPIPIRSLFISDKSHGGLEAPDSNNIQWTFLPNYSDDLAIVTPTDFNPLTDI